MGSEKIISMPVVASVQRQSIGMCKDHSQFSQTVTVILGKEFKTGCTECRCIREEEEKSREEA